MKYVSREVMTLYDVDNQERDKVYDNNVRARTTSSIEPSKSYHFTVTTFQDRYRNCKDLSVLCRSRSKSAQMEVRTMLDYTGGTKIRVEMFTIDCPRCDTPIASPHTGGY